MKRFYICEKCQHYFTAEIIIEMHYRVTSEITGKVISDIDNIFCPDCGGFSNEMIGYEGII